MIRFFTLFNLLILLSSNSFSTEHLKGKTAGERVAESNELWYKTNSTTPSFIRFRDDVNFSEVHTLQWLKEKFDIPSAVRFSLKNSISTEDGKLHNTYSCLIGEIQVEFLKFSLHIDKGRVVSVSGIILDEYSVTNSIVLDESQAINLATELFGNARFAWDYPEEENWIKVFTGDPSASFYPNPELLIVSHNIDYVNSELRYAYRVDITSRVPAVTEDVYVDAQSGEILFRNNRLHELDSTGLAHTAYSGLKQIKAGKYGSKFNLRENGRGNGIITWDLNNSVVLSTAIDFEDEDNIWQFAPGNLDVFATDAHWGTEVTYDYLNAHFGLNSIDNAGHQLNSFVHYGEGYNGSHWDADLKVLIYGNGYNGMLPFTTLDIVGHEIGHGLTQFTADLINQDESGALSESFSDILGNCVEYFGKPGSASWRIGEDRGSFLRDMSFPNAMYHPDTYMGRYWYNGPQDNGGVHTNSGVQNFWFYLLAEGGNGINDNDSSYNVSGIGIMNAALIAYRTLSVYLSPVSDYEDAAFFSTQAAVDIFGNCSEQHKSTVDAWNAVGLANAYLDYAEADFISDEVDYCNLPFTMEFKNVSSNGKDYLWDFGDGTTSVEQNPSHTYNSVGTFDVKLIVDGEGCGVDEIEKLDLVNVSFIEPANAENAKIFIGDSILLTAKSNKGIIHWYEDENATHLIGTGNNYQSPPLSVSTEYYLKVITEANIHLLGPSIDSYLNKGEFSDLSFGVYFKVFQDITLQSVKVNAEKAGFRKFDIIDAGGKVVFSKEIQLVAGIQEVILEADLNVGEFELNCSGPVISLWLANEIEYPFDYSGLVSISGNSLGLIDQMPYFFDWKIAEKTCESEISGVSVTVEDIKTVKRPPYKFYVNDSERINYFMEFFFRDNAKVNFKLFSINGQLVSEFNKEYLKGSSTENVNLLFSLPNRPAGVYFIAVNGGGIEKTEKIVNKKELD